MCPIALSSSSLPGYRQKSIRYEPQSKEISAMLAKRFSVHPRGSQKRTYGGVIENEAGGCIYWHSTSIGGRIWSLTAVELECLELGFSENQ
jgi:hypothetical protein